MAKKINIGPLEPDPFIDLTNEAKEHIKNLDKEIERNIGDLEALEKIGFNVDMPKERLKFAENMRSVLVERFGI